MLSIQEQGCSFEKSQAIAQIDDYRQLQKGNEDNLMSAIATIGPITVAIDASHRSFQFYSSGIYFEPRCDKEELSHCKDSFNIALCYK